MAMLVTCPNCGPREVEELRWLATVLADSLTPPLSSAQQRSRALARAKSRIVAIRVAREPAWTGWLRFPDRPLPVLAGALVVLVALADTLKSLIEQAYDFSRPGVVERMNGLYPDTGRAISASGGQVIASADSIRAGIADFWRDAGSNMREARWEWGQVYLDRLSPAAAVLTATWAIPHIAPTGRPHVIRGAWTAVFRRQAGEWKIVVEHLSVPPT